MVAKWICTADSSHVFDEDTQDHFCPFDPPYHGILIRETTPPPDDTVKAEITAPTDGQIFELNNDIEISANASTTSGSIERVEFFMDGNKIGEAAAPPYSATCSNAAKGEHSFTALAWNNEGASRLSPPVQVTVKQGAGPDVGLCVILMDASSSMTDRAFKESELTRMGLVATFAASGIFDLARMQNNANAYVAAYKFDDRVELMFVDSVANLLERYDRDVRKFASYIHDELYQMQGGTDINKALHAAYQFVDKFIKKQLPDQIKLKNYTPLRQTVLKFGSVESVSIPNVRVLIYTDGRQYDRDGNRELLPNPFREKVIPELNHDVVIGAFFGQENSEGCSELKSLLSPCPRHNELQFFLFDNPMHQTKALQFLFRMASGSSGFCPICLQNQLSQ